MGGDEVPTGAPAAAAVVLATLGVGSWPGAPLIPSSSPLLPGSPAGDGIGVEPHEADGDAKDVKLSGADDVPAEFKSLVEEYYRSLARPRSPQK